MNKLLVLLFLCSGAFAGTSDLVLTCTDDNIPTPYGAARVIVDVFKTADSQYSATIEIFTESNPAKRFRQSKFSADENILGVTLSPNGPAVQIAMDGSETEIPNSKFEVVFFTLPDVENFAEIYFSEENNNDLAIKYFSESCHHPEVQTNP
jgi:hypothetical protein